MRESHTVKVAIIRLINGKPELLLLEHKARLQTALQKNGKYFKEWPRWGLPGGKVEEKETFIEAAIRETEEEIGLKLPKELFSELHASHGVVRASQRQDADTHQEHYYFVFVPSDTEISEIVGNEEIVRAEWFPLEKIPMPDDKLPFTRNQLRGLVSLLRQVENRIEDADLWVRKIEKRAYQYLI